MRITWPQVSFAGKRIKEFASSGGYELARNTVPVGSPCTGLPAISTDTTATCTQLGVLPGNYAYAVTPLLASWRGTTSGTTSVTVPEPSLVLSPNSFTGTTPPTSLSGSLDAFLDEQALAYRLDNPTTGAVLSSNLPRFPTAPASPASTTLQIGCATGASASHSVYVASDRPAPASATFTYDYSQVLCPATVTGTVGSVSGQAQQGDTVSIAFSSAVNGASICSNLAADGSSTLLYDNVEIRLVDGGTAAQDSLEINVPAPSTLIGLGVPAACGSVSPTLTLGGKAGTVTLGTLLLGSKNYVNGAPVVFAGTLAAGTNSVLSFQNNTLTIKLGARVASSGTPLVATDIGPATYTPPTQAPYITGAKGNAIGYQTSGAPLL